MISTCLVQIYRCDILFDAAVMGLIVTQRKERRAKPIIDFCCLAASAQTESSGLHKDTPTRKDCNADNRCG